MRTSIRNQAGFSLVELMVVVSIIGILAAIAIPNFQRFTAKAKQAEAKSALAALYSAERAFHSEWQTYVTSFDLLGYRPTGWVRYTHGFTGAVVPTIAGYPLVGALPGPPQNTTVYCGLGAGGLTLAAACGIINTPIAPGALVGPVAPSTTAFTAAANAHIGNAAAGTFDNWTMTQAKVLMNNVPGLP